MVWRVLLTALLIRPLGSVAATQDCGFCYELNVGMITGIIACDLVLTLLIAVSVYCFASQHKKNNSNKFPNSCDTGKEKLKQPSTRSKDVEITESPYQELHEVQTDIYSDLHQYRK
ncbi:TYRO protein tyrosine kinase-binding protein isoform X2 [Brachyhypopomus gauderio]